MGHIFNSFFYVYQRCTTPGSIPFVDELLKFVGRWSGGCRRHLPCCRSTIWCQRLHRWCPISRKMDSSHRKKNPNLRDGWSIGKTHSMFIFLGYPGIQESNCDMALRCTSNNLVDIQMRFRPSWQWITMPTTPKFPGPYGCGGQQPWWGLAVKLWAIVSIWQQISFQLAGSHISLFPLLLW